MIHNQDTQLPGLWRQMALLAVPATILLVVILGIIYQVEATSQLDAIRSNEQNRIELESAVIGDVFDTIAADMMILAQSNELQALLDADTTANRTAVADSFLLFSTHAERYDQIRYLDTTGMEVVRVNFNNGTPSVVVEENLQNKAGRYYFDDAFALDEGAVFVSPLDLNVEQGQIEDPLKPMIRFGTPVFDSDGNKQGILLLNYFGADLLAQLNQLTTGVNSQTMLVNSDGYYLKGLSPESEWGFMYDDRADLTFGNQFAVWPDVAGGDNGQLLADGELFTYATVYPLLATWQSSTGSGEAFAASDAPVSAADYAWKLVSYVPAAELSPQSLGSINTLISSGGLLFVVILGVSWVVARLRVNQQLADMEIARQRDRLAEQNVVLAHTNTSLETARREADAARQEAEAANQLKSQFLANMSHELRTPLNAILNFSRFVSEGMLGDVNAQQVDTLGKVNDNGKHLLSLINDLLDISKIEAGQLKLFVEDDIDMKKEFDAVTDVAYTLTEGKAVDIITHVDDDLPPMLGDRRRIRQIMLNLVSNAGKFTRTGEIRLDLTHADGWIAFSVADTGIGIAPEDHEMIFQTFRQTKEGLMQGGGTGLGLPISRRLAEIHGGTLTLESTLGKGATFILRMPARFDALLHLKHEQDALVPA